MERVHMLGHRRVAVAFLVVSVFLAMLGGTASASAPPVIGDWEGTLDTGSGSLRVVVHVSQDKDGKLTGSLDSPDQGTSGIPISSISYKEPDLHFEIEQVQGSYVGKMNKTNSEITGTWSQSGASLPLNLKRVAKSK